MCGLVEGKNLVFGVEKPRPGRERGLPLDRKQIYFCPLLEALRGLILVLAAVVAAPT